MAKDDIVRILWTGGLGSTCRLVELSRSSHIIQPYYLIDSSRSSTFNEITAMDEIRKILSVDKLNKSELLPTIFVDVREILPQANISQSWKVLNKKYMLGIQYEWLARFASQYSLVLEVCIENAPTSKARRTLQCECNILRDESLELYEYFIDNENSSLDARNLFENFRFPSTIWNMTKREEIEEIKSLGLPGIVKKNVVLPSSCFWIALRALPSL